jgi:hypothetical protein
MSNRTLDGHVINKVMLHLLKPILVSPGRGRIVGRNAKSENYGHNQREWLLQIMTDSGLRGLSNARPGMNGGGIVDLYNDFHPRPSITQTPQT